MKKKFIGDAISIYNIPGKILLTIIIFTITLFVPRTKFKKLMGKIQVVDLFFIFLLAFGISTFFYWTILNFFGKYN